MELGRVLLLGSFLGSIMVACSSGNTFFYLDGGPDGASSVTGGSDAKADAKKKTDGASDSGEEEEEDSGTSEEDSGTVKTDAAKTDTGGGCTLAATLGTA